MQKQINQTADRLFPDHSYPAIQFSIFRILFGCFLTIEFARIWTYADDLFGPNGFYAIFNQDIGPVAWNIFFGLLIAGAGLFAAGLFRRPMAIALAVAWAVLNFRMPLWSVPSHGYIGWFLLLSALVPEGEPWSLRKRDDNWQMPPLLIESAWIVLGLSYTASGIDKLLAPSWLNGEALRLVAASPVALPTWGRDMILSGPNWLAQTMTWAALAIEIFYAPLCFFRGTRPIAWALIMVLHLQALVLFDIRPVTFMMLLAHGFVFDRQWLKALNRLKITVYHWQEISLAVAITATLLLNIVWMTNKAAASLGQDSGPPEFRSLSESSSGPLVYCSQTPVSGRVTMKGRVILNSLFLPNPRKKPTDEEAAAAVQAQLEFAGFDSKQIVYAHGFESFGYSKWSQKIEITAIKPADYGLDLSIDWPDKIAKPSEQYLQRAAARGFTLREDKAWEISYTLEREATGCVNVPVAQARMEWRLPLDPYLAFWLLEKGGQGLFPCALPAPVAADPRSFAKVWDPLQISRDSRKNFFDCGKRLLPNVHVAAVPLQMDLHEVSKFHEPLLGAGALLKGASEIQASCIIGRSAADGEMPDVAQMREKLNLARDPTIPFVELAKTFKDRGSAYLAFLVRSLASAVPIESLEIRNGATHLIVSLTGKLPGSGRPLKVQVFWGEIGESIAPSSSLGQFLSQSLATSHLVTYLGRYSPQKLEDIKAIDQMKAKSSIPYQALVFAGPNSYSTVPSLAFLSQAATGRMRRDLITNGSAQGDLGLFFTGMLLQIDRELDRARGGLSLLNSGVSLTPDQLLVVQRQSPSWDVK